MKPSSAMALASRMSGHSALACALAGTDFAVVAVIAANAADRRRSRFVNIRTFLLTADACVHKVVPGAVFVLIYGKTAFAKPCEMGHSESIPARQSFEVRLDYSSAHGTSVSSLHFQDT